MKTQTWVRNLAGVIDSRATKETDTVENILLLGLFRRVFLYARINMALCAMIAILPFGADTCRAAEIQKAFESPDAAFKALLDGFNKNSDEAILGILGQDQRDLVVQADKEEAADIRHKVYNCAQEHLQIVTNGDKATARLGIKDWPFPIPMVKHTDGWVFDTAAGKEEILNRRIGENELNAISVCRAYVAAQKEYARRDRTGDKITQYAQKFRSTEGKKDGLYWPAANGEPLSPMGPLVAEAHAEGYGQHPADGKPHPYQGYYFHILTAQGEAAPGGKMDYIVDGHLTKGFAFIATPSAWGASGIMTFIVNQDGKIFEKNLGPDYRKQEKPISEYNPDKSWEEVKD